MAAQIGTQLDPEKPLEGEGASTDDAEATPPYLPAQNASWEYFRLFGGHAPLAQFASAALHDQIGKIQIRWARVAGILHLHYDMTAGGHMKRRGGASIGKVIELLREEFPRQGSQRRDLVGHLDGVQGRCSSRFSCRLLLADAKVRTGREGWGQSAQLSAYRVVMLAPEAVLAVGKSLQDYGLDVEVHGREDPLFDPNTVWRIPDWVNVEPLPPPPRKLTYSDIHHLNARRAHRPAREASPTLGGNSMESPNDRRTE